MTHPSDLPAIEAAWRAFEAEVPAPSYRDGDTDRELTEIAEIVAGEIAIVADGEGRLAGFALARAVERRVVRLTDLYVAPDARRGGIAAALVRAVVEAAAERGATTLDLEVQSSNAAARAVYQRWGFADESLVLAAPIEHLRDRLRPSVHAARSPRSTSRPTTAPGSSGRRASSPRASAPPAAASRARGTAGRRSTTRPPTAIPTSSSDTPARCPTGWVLS